ncbi:DUF4221 family protein [Algoriphagus marinus]|uniref:DUF4221 family protein n=1 Tax=Algoriphagus marinus TaxID=1925762 RepID=UPI00094B96A0|nr:DUF4221 family protein [Algoriphagus marinus]
MKKPLYLAVLVGFFACSEKDVASDSDRSVDFSYSLDTVIVDAGDEFIYLNWDLTASATSPDGSYLYNWDQGKNSVQFINLENLMLEKILPLEVEGPNGIGTDRVYHIYTSEDNKLVLTDTYTVAVIDFDGKKSLGFQYVNSGFKGDKLPETMRITYQEFISNDGKFLIATYGDLQMNEPPSGIALFDLEKKELSLKSIPTFYEQEPYLFKYYFDGNLAGMNEADIHLMMKNDSVIFSSSVFNKVYFYQFATDSTTSLDFQSKYTSTRAPGNYPKQTNTYPEFMDIAKVFEQEVSYGRLFFDDQNKVYWRFAKEMDSMKGDTIQYKTVLTAFDPQFNQLHEELLPSDFDLPDTYFAREGMIYTFLNINDELAFVRIKPTFTYE